MALEDFNNLVKGSSFYDLLSNSSKITAFEQFLPVKHHPYYDDIAAANIAKNKTGQPDFLTYNLPQR